MDVLSKMEVDTEAATGVENEAEAEMEIEVEKVEMEMEVEKELPCLYKLMKNEAFGRHFVASQDIPAGTLVLKENPVIVEPVDPNGDVDPFEVDDPKFSCVSCCLEMETLARCDKCRLPICSQKCAEAPQHRDYECKIFSQNNLKDLEKIPPMIMYPTMPILKGMMIKKNDPGLWAKVSNLQSEPEKNLAYTGKNGQHQQDKSKSPFEKFSQMLQFSMFKKCFTFSSSKLEFLENTQDWDKIQGVMDINGFSLDYNFDNSAKKTRVRNLYIECSMLNHGCYPNCTWSFGPGPEFTMEIWTAVDIPKGEPLTIMYSKNATLVGTLERQKLGLKSRSSFFCLCPRCIDPIESGTMFSAIKCQCRTPDGFIVTTNPLKLDADWMCQNDGCKSVMSCTEVEALIEEYRGQIESMYQNDLATPGFVEQFQNEMLEKFGRNHWLILTLARVVMQRIDDQKEGSHNEEYILDLYISMAKKVDRMYDLIMPGLHWQKGEVKMKLYKALLAKYQKVSSTSARGRENFFSQTQQLVEIYRIQNEIWELRRRDPTCRKNITEFVTDLEELKSEMEFTKEVLDDRTAKLEKGVE